jgi:hypothetical protein
MSGCVGSTATTPGPQQLLLGDDVQLGDLEVEAAAKVAGGRDRPVEQLLAVADELPPRAVDARQQHGRRARGLLELEAQLQALAVDALAADRQHRRLPQAGEGLLDAADRQVRALRERTLRQLRMPGERVVQAPGVVGHQGHVARVARLRDRAHVGRGAVVARGEDDDRLRVGMPLERGGDGLGGRDVRDLELLVVDGVDPRRHGPVHDESGDR